MDNFLERQQLVVLLHRVKSGLPHSRRTAARERADLLCPINSSHDV